MFAMKLLATTICILAATSFSLADSVKSLISKRDAQVTKALKEKDMDKFSELMKAEVTPDFQYIDMGKSQTLDAMLSEMKSSLDMMKRVSVCTSKIVSFRKSGEMITCKVRRVMGGEDMGPDKKLHKSMFAGTSTDEYKKIDGEWKLASMKWSDQMMTMDGKPMKM